MVVRSATAGTKKTAKWGENGQSFERIKTSIRDQTVGKPR